MYLFIRSFVRLFLHLFIYLLCLLFPDKPTNVTLKFNILRSKGCKGDVVEFKCEAQAANPAIHTYLLYKNGKILANMGSDEVARRPLDTEGPVAYKCEATNSFGTSASANKTVIVDGFHVFK